ncbi:Mth938-like domain-containing protein [Thalassospiraceae bacterium LMO-JJ14]|nr:Mth938-like domain-containing protein [Thalassospiraceae bacterium LMO-JJ14]
MSLDINPVVPNDRQLIQSYGDGRFKVTGEVYEGSILVFPERTRLWPVTHFEHIDHESLSEVVAERDAVDILLVGCGERFKAVPKGLRAALKDAGIVLEWMDTGAACRTYNVLVAEERRVAAAILAVD